MKKALKKPDSKNVGAVAGKTKENKQTGYLKLTINDETGKAEATDTEAKDLFYMGTFDLDLVNKTVSQICNIINRGNPLTETTTLSVNAALAAIHEIDPQDSVELMLATQMATVHNLSMEMGKRAMLEEQTYEGIDSNINRVAKLMRTFTAQIEALNKYRSKGKQRILVKHQHVNVNEGGQAIVGDVNQGEGNG